jgi:salicylate hydroxylase
MDSILIAGGGIGGLATALALAQQGRPLQLLERQTAFSETGAGIQLGPNVMRVLGRWQGLDAALRPYMAYPEQLCVCEVERGQSLAQMNLRELAQRYGAPWATVHRRDLHRVLLEKVREQAQVEWHLGQTVNRITTTEQDLVRVDSASGHSWQGLALVGADGVHSHVRQHLLQDGPPRSTGHQAYRALLRASQVPLNLRQNRITVWMGAQLHAVFYPVCGGEAFNVVVVTNGWQMRAGAIVQANHTQALRQQLVQAQACADLQALAAAHDDWGLWEVWDRPPMRSPLAHAQGRIALLGDAAHPMRPYLAQGAGMAIEDAQVLGQCLQGAQAAALPERLRAFAQQRWRRNALVQQGAIRNGRIYHAQGLVRWGRNWALRLLGPRLLDQPWLYGACI